MKRTELRRKTAINKVSPRHRKFSAELKRAKSAVFFRSRGYCEARTPFCTGCAQHVHHIAGRVGPAANDPDNLLHLCGNCHRWIHSHPLESYDRGWLLHKLSSPLHGNAGDDDGAGSGARGDPATRSVGWSPFPPTCLLASPGTDISGEAS